MRKKAAPIALLLMDQSVVSGIGNVYRAELLFRARLDPFTLGKDIPEDLVRALWRDWVHLLNIGVDDRSHADHGRPRRGGAAQGARHRDDRHWVYHRTGEPCRRLRHPDRDAGALRPQALLVPDDQA